MWVSFSRFFQHQADWTTGVEDNTLGSQNAGKNVYIQPLASSFSMVAWGHALHKTTLQSRHEFYLQYTTRYKHKMHLSVCQLSEDGSGPWHCPTEGQSPSSSCHRSFTCCSNADPSRQCAPLLLWPQLLLPYNHPSSPALLNLFEPQEEQWREGLQAGFLMDIFLFCETVSSTADAVYNCREHSLQPESTSDTESTSDLGHSDGTPTLVHCPWTAEDEDDMPPPDNLQENYPQGIPPPGLFHVWTQSWICNNSDNTMYPLTNRS